MVFRGDSRAWLESTAQSQSAGDAGSPMQLRQRHTADQIKKFFLTPFLFQEIMGHPGLVLLFTRQIERCAPFEISPRTLRICLEPV